jgi:hypothetical protein
MKEIIENEINNEKRISSHRNGEETIIESNIGEERAKAAMKIISWRK